MASDEDDEDDEVMEDDDGGMMTWGVVLAEVKLKMLLEDDYVDYDSDAEGSVRITDVDPYAGTADLS